MDLEHLRGYCLAKQGASEGTPFGENVLVYSVAGKMFALTESMQVPLTVNLKCDPERAVELRERHESILPGWHMNKKHWNTVILDGSISDREVRALIDHSYELVIAGLPKRVREEMGW